MLAPNPNTVSAGTLRGGVLTIELDAVMARWHAEGGPSVKFAEAFAERGKAPTIPGPLTRAPAGTPIRFSVRNTLARPITFYVPTSPAMDDSIVIAPGTIGEIRARAAKPGNYIYRATDGTTASQQLRIAGALAGALVVDSMGVARPPNDRVMMILMTPDSTLLRASRRHQYCRRGHRHLRVHDQRTVVAQHRASVGDGGRHGALARDQRVARRASHAPPRILLSRRRVHRAPRGSGRSGCTASHGRHRTHVALLDDVDDLGAGARRELALPLSFRAPPPAAGRRRGSRVT